jgi:hypothetical protein
MNTSYIENEIERLTNKKNTIGLNESEYESLMEYEGRLASIEAEIDFLNGCGDYY